MIGSAGRVVSLILALALSFAGLVGATWFLFLAPIYSFKMAAASNPEHVVRGQFDAVGLPDYGRIDQHGFQTSH